MKINTISLISASQYAGEYLCKITDKMVHLHSDCLYIIGQVPASDKAQS